MRAFGDLFADIDKTTSLNDKVEALAAYFRVAPAADAAWAVALLSGRRPKKPMSSREISDGVCRFLGIEPWVLEESYALVGDLGETVSLLIDTLRAEAPAGGDDAPLHVWMEERLPALARMDAEERYAALAGWWRSLSMREIFVLQKLIGGSFRVGASESLVVKAVAQAKDLPVAVVTERVTGKWTPDAAFYQRLTAPAEAGVAGGSAQPYPFALAHPMDSEPDTLGPLEDWLAEWKWDGIRAQIVKRAGEVHVWSRGEDLVTPSFPELAGAAAHLPDGTVVDGEILAFAADGDAPLPFAALQKRLGRKKVSAAVAAATPVRFLAYDMLELDGADWREKPLADRRVALAALMAAAPAILGLSPAVEAGSWEELRTMRAGSRERSVEGLMLKRRTSAYRSGRRKGDWWKWKVDPLAVDAVLIYAQAGSGRRANLFTDYTFAVWDAEKLVPVAKAYSGLDQGEIAELDRWIRAHTKEKFGPVRSVEAEQVFELAFEGIAESGRHKAGVALRFPRITRWRKDKKPADADSLGTLRGMLNAPN